MRPLIGITADIEDGRLTLKKDYADAIINAGGIPVLIPLSGSPKLYAERLDGFLIPGGGDIAPSYYGEPEMPGVLKKTPVERTDFEIGLICEIMRLRKPLHAICYGMQMVNVVMGGGLYQDIGSMLPGALDHKVGHEVKVLDGGPIKAGIYSVNSAHHQAVKSVGKGLSVLAVSDDGIVEALYGRGYPFLVCVQWHPERMSPPAPPELFDIFIGACRHE